MSEIEIHGARTRNLKNISCLIPRNKLIVITGLSGSGKSSLAFNTLYAEAQRRYVESLSTYARQFLSLMEKPDVDYIEGLSPSISIEKRSTSYNSRSTVGTVTEIYDYLRILYARVGEPHCPDHNIPLEMQTISQMVDKVLSCLEGKRLMLLAPIVRESKGAHKKTLEKFFLQGYIRARIDGEICNLSDSPNLIIQKKHTIEIVVDRFKVNKNLKQRLAESFETALNLSGGIALVTNMNEKQEEILFSSNFACVICGYSIPKLEPRFFSFNNRDGACHDCDGFGVQQYCNPDRVLQNQDISLADGAIPGWDRHNFCYFQMLSSLAKYYKFDITLPFNSLDPDIQKKILFGSDQKNIEFKYINKLHETSINLPSFEGILPNIERRYKATKSGAVRKELAKYISNRICSSCNGTRIRKEARYVFLDGTPLPKILEMNIDQAVKFFDRFKLSGQRAQIAESVLKEIRERLKFLDRVGLSYLSLSRKVETLSSGEAKRINLASQISTRLVGMIYIIDEPSISLHQRDHKRLLNILLNLRDIGNTVIVVEHDENSIRSADYIVDIGPGAGIHGGNVVAEGSIKEIMANPKSLTGQFLSGKKEISIPLFRIQPNPSKFLKLIGARGNNLKNVTLMLPVGLFICITGVSGSGKSTLIDNTLFPIMQQKINGITNSEIAPYHDIKGLEYFNKVINIQQNNIGRTDRSNTATYIGIFTTIRELFAAVTESRARGYTPSRFSFNIRGGRCEACQGDGVIKVKMHFLPNIYVSCDHCKGQRYNRETLDIKYKGKNIHEVLEMTIEEAKKFFNFIPTLSQKLQILIDVGLSYICLGQSVNTLSEGEMQRIKLARALTKDATGRTLYIFDEPTTGLHFADIHQLLLIFYELRNQGNTVVVMEHNLDVIKTADWIVDLGPEGGIGGGRILVSGTPETVANCEISHTARFLRSLFKSRDSKI